MSISCIYRILYSLFLYLHLQELSVRDREFRITIPKLCTILALRVNLQLTSTFSVSTVTLYVRPIQLLIYTLSREPCMRRFLADDGQYG